MNNKIKCRICNKELGRQGLSLHLKTHDTTFKDYLEKYLDDFDDFQKCETCGKTCKRNKKFCSRKCTTEWRKTLVGENGLRYGATMSEESKQKISESQKQRLKRDGHHFLGKTRTDEYKKKMSKVMTGKLVGEKNGMYGKPHTPEAIKKIFSHKKMNKLEKKVAKYLDSKNIDYTFQFFINEDDICKSYDFKFDNIILEVHGDYWHGGSGVKKHHFDVDNTIKNDKLKKKIAEERGYTVKVVWEHDLKNDVTILDNLIS
jgi:G:T-mismatch repair DNA endonuclease (very short patch repair protein)